jgi:hypothetical protein
MALALLFTVTAAVPAAADGSTQATGGAAGVTHQGAAARSEARAAGAERTAVVQLPGARFVPQPSPRRSGLEAPWLAVGVAGLASERRQQRSWTLLPWLKQSNSELALLLSERLSLGVGYRHVHGEDLWREFADTGSMDYESHNFLFRAHWRF